MKNKEWSMLNVINMPYPGWIDKFELSGRNLIHCTSITFCTALGIGQRYHSQTKVWLNKLKSKMID
jgi:hypothetical protein